MVCYCARLAILVLAPLTRHACADNDLLIVRELRKMSSLSKRGEKMAPRASEEELKWLNWPDFVQVQWPLMQLHMTLGTLNPSAFQR